jgi:hypothetical protein
MNSCSRCALGLYYPIELVMFERYTEGARRVVFFARYEASQCGSPYIETGHLLLALFREDPKLLRRIAPTLSRDAVATAVENDLGQRHRLRTSTAVDLPLSNGAKRTLAYAAEEAERLGNLHIGSEHLLLGLLREKQGVAFSLLTDAGTESASVRQILGKGVDPAIWYCPHCAREVCDPLTCGDCSAVICRVCGTPLESSEELGIG